MNQVRFMADASVGMAGMIVLLGFTTAGMVHPELASRLSDRVVLVLVMLACYALGRIAMKKGGRQFAMHRETFHSVLLATCFVGLTLACIIR